MAILRKFAIGLFVIAASWGFGVTSALSSWAEIPLYKRIRDADIVVVGKLIHVKDYASIEYAGDPDRKSYPSRPTRMHYQVGELVVETVLKESYITEGQKKLRAGSTLPFAFYSDSEIWNNKEMRWSRTIVSNYESLKFAEGDRGIWILERPVFLYAYGITYPDNFLPVDSLIAVKTCVDSLNTH